MYTVHDLYDLTHTQAAPLLEELKTLGCTEEDLLQLWRGGETYA